MRMRKLSPRIECALDDSVDSQLKSEPQSKQAQSVAVPPTRRPAAETGRSIVWTSSRISTARGEQDGHNDGESSGSERGGKSREFKRGEGAQDSLPRQGFVVTANPTWQCPASKHPISPPPSMTAPALPAKCACFRGVLNRNKALGTCNRQWSIVGMMGADTFCCPLQARTLPEQWLPALACTKVHSLSKRHDTARCHQNKPQNLRKIWKGGAREMAWSMSRREVTAGCH